MSFIRYTLASLGIACMPKIGLDYRYASQGPFDLGPKFIPRQIKQGYVLYEMVQTSGFVSQLATTCGVFASMYRVAA